MNSYSNEQLNFYFWLLCFLGVFMIVGFLMINKYEKFETRFDMHILAAIPNIAHDENQWFFVTPTEKIPSCVGYGDPKTKCPRHSVYCAGGKTFGTADQQLGALFEAGGLEHKLCPLL